MRLTPEMEREWQLYPRPLTGCLQCGLHYHVEFQCQHQNSTINDGFDEPLGCYQPGHLTESYPCIDDYLDYAVKYDFDQQDTAIIEGKKG